MKKRVSLPLGYGHVALRLLGPAAIRMGLFQSALPEELVSVAIGQGVHLASGMAKDEQRQHLLAIAGWGIMAAHPLGTAWGVFQQGLYSQLPWVLGLGGTRIWGKAGGDCGDQNGLF